MMILVFVASALAFQCQGPVRHPTRRCAEQNDGGPIKYLSTVDDKPKQWNPDDENAPSDPRAHVQQTEAVNAGPANYEGYVDAADGFDGGDGQVGVVGDGTNAMETYDMSERVKTRRMNAVKGSESKKTRSNVWGYTTGYADELAKRGMVDVDQYGEDRLKQRRQQLENWRNQRELRIQKEGQMRDLYNLQGKAYEPSRHGSYFDDLEAKRKPKQAQSSEQVYGMVAGDRVDGNLEIVSQINTRGGVTLSIQNEYSTYADFVAGFVDGSSTDFAVEPTGGTLNRRGGAPTDFVITFLPQSIKDASQNRAIFVVETEEHKWTYYVQGVLQ